MLHIKTHVVAGIHIEGPFISPEPGAVGAHPVEHTRAPDVALFDKLCELARGYAGRSTAGNDNATAIYLPRRFLKVA